eukprot:2442031-Pleurochrysis_carterae.AAC.1
MVLWLRIQATSLTGTAGRSETNTELERGKSSDGKGLSYQVLLLCSCESSRTTHLKMCFFMAKLDISYRRISTVERTKSGSV